MRVDKQKNIKALKNELIKNPLQTEEELAKKIWIARWSVNRLKDEMSEIVTNAKNSDIVAITDTDREIIELSQFLSKSKLLNMKMKFIEEWDLELRDVKTWSEIAKESTARYTLFRWSATDDQWWLKTPAVIEILNPNT